MLAAFVIYLAVNQRFGVYYNVLIGPSASAPAAPSTSTLGVPNWLWLWPFGQGNPLGSAAPTAPASP